MAKKDFPTLNIKTGNQDSTVQRAKSRLVKHFLVIALIIAVIICLTLTLRFTWHRLYLENDRLTLKLLKFNETQHYSADTRNGHISIATILSENNIELGKTNLLALNLNKVQSMLAKHPLLTHVKISKVLPDTLEILAVERTPIAVLCPANNGTMLAQFPIAEKPLPEDPTCSPAAILLPDSLNLYDARRETTVNWNYVIYPIPFSHQVVNTSIPYLFGFPNTNGSPEPGQIEKSPKLAAAITLLKLAGVTSSNKYFNIKQIKLKEPDTLRVTVMPTPASNLIKNYAQFDFSCSNINEQSVRNILDYLHVLEGKPKSNPIMYLNATGTTLYSSPKPPRN